MLDEGPTLADLLATVPQLLDTCVHPCQKKCPMFAAMRLVSKELSVTAMRTVTSCHVTLGDGARPTLLRVARIMQPASLARLNVKIVTTSGQHPNSRNHPRPAIPSMSHQLATCTSQMADLVQRMGPAIQSVQNLTITFKHKHIECSPISYTYGRPRTATKPTKLTNSTTTTAVPTATAAADVPEPPRGTGCPISFAAFSHAICAMLAAAVPNLVSLTVEGGCTDPAFSAFGAACPSLTALQVEALSLPIEALADITTHLVKLNHFSLKSPSLDGVQLSDYVEAALLALQPSAHLASISLKFHTYVKLECKPGRWLNIPPNLHFLECVDCTLAGIANSPALLSSLRSLHIAHASRFEEVFQILALAPHLQQLKLTSEHRSVLWCNGAGTMQGILQLQERLLNNNLQFHLPSLHVVGSSAEVAALLAVMPVLSRSAQTCVIQFQSPPQPNCLADVARVFPSLRELSLMTETSLARSPTVGTQMLRALIACTSLITLKVHLKMSHTTMDLVSLCTNMPALQDLWYVKCAGVHQRELWYERREWCCTACIQELPREETYDE